MSGTWDRLNAARHSDVLRLIPRGAGHSRAPDLPSHCNKPGFAVERYYITVGTVMAVKRLWLNEDHDVIDYGASLL